MSKDFEITDPDLLEEIEKLVKSDSNFTQGEVRPNIYVTKSDKEPNGIACIFSTTVEIGNQSYGVHIARSKTPNRLICRQYLATGFQEKIRALVRSAPDFTQGEVVPGIVITKSGMIPAGGTYHPSFIIGLGKYLIHGHDVVDGQKYDIYLKTDPQNDGEAEKILVGKVQALVRDSPNFTQAEVVPNVVVTKSGGKSPEGG